MNKLGNLAAAVAAALVALVPIVSTLITLYSDVKTMKETKADATEVSELRLDFTSQMIKSNTVLENLDRTLQKFERRLDLYGK